jgi:hypothetical protein
MTGKTKRVTQRLAIMAGIAALAISVVASPAHATNVNGSFDADITVYGNGAATAYVSDTIEPTNSYTIALTGSGGGTCLLTTGEQLLIDFATGGGNPASASIGGGCNFYNADVLYTLTWTTLLGTTGQIQVDCVWAIGIKVCTPGHVHGNVGDIVQPLLSD